MKSIYIQTLTSEKIAVLTENQTVKHIAFDRVKKSSKVGNIYVGRVVRVDTGLQAAFIDIGEKKLAFLLKKEIPASRKDKRIPIEGLIYEGMSIVVQVIKDAYSSKGASVTANITIPGQYSIYLPFGNYVAFSKQLSNQVKDKLQGTFQQWKMGEEGVIFRTASKKADREELKKEWEFLRSSWKQLYKDSQKIKRPSLIFEEQDIPNRFLRKFATLDVEKIVFDESEVAQQAKSIFPHLAEKMKWEGAFQQNLPFSIEALIDSITSKRVKISSGVELIMEKTEALTVIDVNTASYVGKLDKESTVYHTNVMAVKEIAKQIQLRNIAGIIVIDFINMKDEKHKKQLLEELEKHLKEDPVYTKIYGFTNLGMVEMTRKREGLDSYSLFCKDNEHILSDEALAYRLERELLNYRKKDAEAFLLELPSTLLQYVLTSLNLEKLQKTLKKPVFYEQKALENHPYVVKFIGDVHWLEHLRDNGHTIDKLF